MRPGVPLVPRQAGAMVGCPGGVQQAGGTTTPAAGGITARAQQVQKEAGQPQQPQGTGEEKEGRGGPGREAARGGLRRGQQAHRKLWLW